MNTIDQLYSRFNHPQLLSEALTHRSRVNEHPQTSHNERLEFLGDAVLQLFVSQLLFQTFPNQPEGFLTALRSKLVNTEHLAQCAQRIGLDKAVLLSRGEEETGGRQNPSLLADCIEAVIGAVYLDQGCSAAQAVIEEYVLYDLNQVRANPLKDAKSRLQEKIQSQGLPAPVYRVIKSTGPDHAKTFTVEVVSGKKVLGTGTGKSKAEAEQNAAQKALQV